MAAVRDSFLRALDASNGALRRQALEPLLTAAEQEDDRDTLARILLELAALERGSEPSRSLERLARAEAMFEALGSPMERGACKLIRIELNEGFEVPRASEAELRAILDLIEEGLRHPSATTPPLSLAHGCVSAAQACFHLARRAGLSEDADRWMKRGLGHLEKSGFRGRLAKAWADRATLARERGLPEASLAHANAGLAVLRCAPPPPTLLLALGWLLKTRAETLIALGRKAEAVADLEEALRLWTSPSDDAPRHLVPDLRRRLDALLIK
jgi:tetratricopeptide (TPR) repeat protein